MRTQPFAYDNSEARFPNNTERQNGFPCGPADQNLFNGIFKRIESELGHVIDFAGIVGSDADLTQLRQAIQAIALSVIGSIEDTGGSIDTSQFILIGQARARLPIFPEILNGTGLMGVTSPSTGTVRVPAGVTFQHRGIFPLVTSQTDLVTTASKTYHLRWNPTDGFVLRDLADNAYNPTSAPEASQAFDSTYDDMLVARVVTNGSNIATITNLVNRDRLAITDIISGSNKSGSLYDVVRTYNWARAPKTYAMSIARHDSSDGDHDFTFRPIGSDGTINSMPAQFDVNRYRLSQRVKLSNSQFVEMQFTGAA